MLGLADLLELLEVLLRLLLLHANKYIVLTITTLFMLLPHGWDPICAGQNQHRMPYQIVLAVNTLIARINNDCRQHGRIIHQVHLIIIHQLLTMGNLCQAEQLPHESPISLADIRIAQPHNQHHLQQQLTRKYASIRVQATSLPIVNNHVQDKIKRFTRFQPADHKIWRLKHPYNLIYMNQAAEDQYQLPKGYAKIYKLRQNGDFQGYYEGRVTENFQPDLTQGFFVFHNASFLEGRGANQGVYTNEVTNLKYEGGWLKQQPHGNGLEHNNKGVYQGQYFEGEKHGQGKFIWNDRTYYQGTFSKGCFHGQGHYVNPNLKYSYQGQYCNDLKHGTGIQNKTKETYSGQFFKNKRCGRGKLVVYSDQAKTETKFTYEGLFDNNKPTGKGTFSHAQTQNKINGIWNEGVLVAICQ